ncbi:MAG: DUF551 domain-containing protein [Desulfobulbia bacterium]
MSDWPTVKKLLEFGIESRAAYERVMSKYHMVTILRHVAALESQQQWISVEDRLPEKEGSYLVYSPAYYGVTIMEFYSLEDDEGGWWFDDSSPTSGNTHWMPLPPPPEME